jgi:hypothetical protein
VGLVVSVVPALVEVHLRRSIDTMRRRGSVQRPTERVVCLVVLIVVALGQVLFHVQPPSICARLAAEQSSQLIIRVRRMRRTSQLATLRVAYYLPWAVHETSEQKRCADAT